MPDSSSQALFRKLDKTGVEQHRLPDRGARRVSAGARIILRTAADKLRSNLHAAVYKHALLGLIFLKYVSDAVAEGQKKIAALLKDADNDYCVYFPASETDLR